MTFFAADGLVMDFGGIRAVDGVSFTVEPGHVFTIIGPVGADDREDLARLDREAHAVDRPQAAEVHDQAVRGEEAHRRRSERM